MAMTKLDDILDNFESECVGLCMDYRHREEVDKSEAKQAIKAVMLELIGKDEPVPAIPELQEPELVVRTGWQNNLRVELRQKVEEL